MKKRTMLLIPLLSAGVLQAEPTPGGQTLTAIGGFDRYGAQYTNYTQKKPALGFGVEVVHLSNYLSPEGETLAGFAQARVAASNGRWRNFVFCGFGANQTHTSGDGFHLENTSTSWAAQLGLGTDYYLTHHLFVGLELRDMLFDRDHDVINVLGLYLRVGVKWGGK